MSLRKLKGRLLFPHPIVFSADLQDTGSEILVQQSNGLIALPRLPDTRYQDDAAPDLLPPSAAPGDEFSVADQFWGRVVTDRNHFSANSAYLELALPSDGAEFDGMQEVDTEVRSWLAALMDWLRILTGQDLRHDAPMFWERPDMTPGWFYVTQDGQILGDYFSVHGHATPYPGSTSAGAKDWQRALRLSSQGSTPDVARLLLQDAIGALDRKQPRRSFLDTSSAAELLLTKALRARFLERNEEAVADILLDRATLGKKVELCRKFGVWYPRRFSGRVTSVRNDVAHRAVHPTWEQARLAIVETWKLLAHHFPFEWEQPYDPKDDLEDD